MKDNEVEFEEWIRNNLFSYVFSEGGYFGDILIFDEVVIVTHQSKYYSPAIYNRKMLEEIYQEYKAIQIGQHGFEREEDEIDMQDLIYQAEINFDDVTITIKETKND